MHPKSPCFLVSRPCALRPDGGVGGWAHSRPALIFASLFLAQTRPTRCVRALFALVCLFAMSPSPRRCRTLASRLASRLARMLGLGPPPSKLQKQRNDLPPLAFREIARFCVEPRDVAALARTCRAAADACADRLGELRVVPARGRTYRLHANGRCDVTPRGSDGKPFRLSGVVSVTEASHAFAALTRSGTVVTWGHPRAPAGRRHLLVDVASVSATSIAFTALTRSGGVVTWGHPQWGGDSAAVQHLGMARPRRRLGGRATPAGRRRERDGDGHCVRGADTVRHRRRVGMAIPWRRLLGRATPARGRCERDGDARGVRGADTLRRRGHLGMARPWRRLLGRAAQAGGRGQCDGVEACVRGAHPLRYHYILGGSLTDDSDSSVVRHLLVHTISL